jgi:hypothetical protein
MVAYVFGIGWVDRRPNTKSGDTRAEVPAGGDSGVAVELQETSTGRDTEVLRLEQELADAKTTITLLEASTSDWTPPRWWASRDYSGGSLALTEQHFEDALARAEEAAPGIFEPDVKIAFRSVELFSLEFHFVGWIASNGYHFAISIKDTQVGFHIGQRLPFGGRGLEPYVLGEQPPWRHDDSWRRLLVDVAGRVDPADKSLILYAPTTPTARRDSGPPVPAGWHVCRRAKYAEEQYCWAFRDVEPRGLRARAPA